MGGAKHGGTDGLPSCMVCSNKPWHYRLSMDRGAGCGCTGRHRSGWTGSGLKTATTAAITLTNKVPRLPLQLLPLWRPYPYQHLPAHSHTTSPPCWTCTSVAGHCLLGERWDEGCLQALHYSSSTALVTTKTLSWWGDQFIHDISHSLSIIHIQCCC